jgi:hypothetical protein
MADRVLHSTPVINAERRIDPGAGEDEIEELRHPKLTHFGDGSGAFLCDLCVSAYTRAGPF